MHGVAFLCGVTVKLRAFFGWGRAVLTISGAGACFPGFNQQICKNRTEKSAISFPTSVFCLGNHHQHPIVDWPNQNIHTTYKCTNMKEHSRSSVSLMFGRRPISDGRLPQPPVHHRTPVKYIIIYITYIILQMPPLHHRTLVKETPYIANCDTGAIYCKDCKQTCQKAAVILQTLI